MRKFEFSRCVKFVVWEKQRFEIEAETEEEARELAKQYVEVDVKNFPESEPYPAEYFKSFIGLMSGNDLEPTVEVRDFMTDELIADNTKKPIEEEKKKESESPIEYVVVDVSKRLTGVYTCEKDRQKIEDGKVRAEQKAKEDAALFRTYAEIYSDSYYWVRRAEECERAQYEVMTFDEFLQKQREEVLAMPVQESTEEEFWKQLEVLPPFIHGTIGDMELFCMSEFDFGTYTSQYARKGDKYYFATVDAYDQTTWIPNRLPQ